MYRPYPSPLSGLAAPMVERATMRGAPHIQNSPQASCQHIQPAKVPRRQRPREGIASMEIVNTAFEFILVPVADFKPNLPSASASAFEAVGRVWVPGAHRKSEVPPRTRVLDGRVG